MMLSPPLPSHLASPPPALPAHSEGGNCWNKPCDDPTHTCFVKHKLGLAGLALCRTDCPATWLCETRVDGGCGAAPLPPKLPHVSARLRALLTSRRPWLGVSLCDRASPPAGVLTFEISCFDGGMTGNRWVMVSNLLRRAACCAGVALLPPEFDHFPSTGASCFDFTAMRKVAHVKEREPLRLTPPAHQSCAANVSTSSKHWWWSPMLRETQAPPRFPPLPPTPAPSATGHSCWAQASCSNSSAIESLVSLLASMYVGFAVPGHVFGDKPCVAAARPSPPLVMHVRSGDIFTNWADGKHIHKHAGYQHDPFARGQPPLAFYRAAMEHHASLHLPNESSAMVVTSPDKANPILPSLLNGTAPPGAGTSIPVELSSSASFEADLTQLICAESLALSLSSLNPLLLSAPNAREVYFFTDKGCDAVNTSCRITRLAPAPPRRFWCISGYGTYRLLQNWRNDDAQRKEMLTYPVHAPVQVQGAPDGCVA
ncbi:hypothetical protein AB1Y20_004879 [Prymnesium parvum]|uniref:Uncharacterized protein n=1 Tax=Prymnesium parvum TaxID=97485 RepID=A0AB34IYQ6_PRYPA